MQQRGRVHQLGDDRQCHATAGTPTGRGGARREQREQRPNSLATRTKQRLGCRCQLAGTRTRRGDEQTLQPIAGVQSLHPITRLIDCNLYVRPAEGGLMVGGYESDPLQLDMSNLPAAFGIEDMPLDLSVLRRLIDRATDQFPVLRDIAVKEHRGGLPTMTADGEHIVGPLPGIRGLYVAGGCCVGGLTIAPIIGELLAEWIISGQPRIDDVLLDANEFPVE